MTRLSILFVTFLTLGGCAASAEDSSSSSESAILRDEPGIKVRIVAGNLTSGNKQSWDPGDGVRILKGLGADVAVLQEFNYKNNSDADYKEFLAEAFEPDFHYTVEKGVQIPNAVVSRYPIVDQGVWDDPQVANRSFVWARIDVPGDKDLWAISLHLLTSGSQKRQAEATALAARIKATIPESDYLVIGGDLNTGSRTEQCLTTLGRFARTTGPWPVDSKGNGNTSRTRSKPYDWLLADADLEAHQIPVRIGDDSFANGLVFDSRNYPDLDAVEPARQSDSGSVNMQHMAVVKDFTLPAAPVGNEAPNAQR